MPKATLDAPELPLLSTRKQVAKIFGFSNRHLDSMGRDGKLPKPIYCGVRSSRWKRDHFSPISTASRPGQQTMSSQAVVDDIQRLHELMTPVSAIARTLHLSENAIRHAIEFGRLPEQQPHWKPQRSDIEA